MKGICFKEPLFHKTVKREKTQTRRLITPQPDSRGFRTTDVMFEDWHGKEFKPKYRVDEIVYLKEPYAISGSYIIYKFGSTIGQECDKAGVKWNNKLFMLASAARYFIRITAVRAERLQDISEEDCLKEGIEIKSDAKVIGYPFGVKFPYNNGYGNYSTAREAYAALIDQINGKGTWERNPFVWVYDYQKINIR